MRDHIGKNVVFDAIPGIENEAPARLQNPHRLSIAGNAVWEKHDAKLTAHDVKHIVIEWQIEGIGLLPVDTRVRWLLRHSPIKHWLVQVRHRVTSIARQQRRQGTGYHTTASCGLQDTGSATLTHPLGQVRGKGIED